MEVAWSPMMFGPPSSHRATDMLVVTVAADGCGTEGPLDMVIRYDAPLISHNLTSPIKVQRDSNGPTQVFFPVFSLAEFDRTLLRFSALEVQGRSVECITRVARVADRSLPLWMQMQVPADWHARPYHQELRYPRFLKFLE